MQTVVALIILLIFIVLLPFMIGRLKKHAKSSLGGAVLAIGVIFANLFDPAKGTAIEEVEKSKRKTQQDGQAERLD